MLKLLIILLILIATPVRAQGDPAPVDEARLGELIDRLYTVEGFQQRFGAALQNNPTFLEHHGNKVFIDDLTKRARESALATYSASIQTALANLSPEEVENLIEALDSPGGALLLKVFTLDNVGVESGLAEYVNTIAEESRVALAAYDSVLFHREFYRDLSEIMDSEYIDVLATGDTLFIKRRGDYQTEVIRNDTFNFTIDWQSNSRYSIADREGNPMDLGKATLVNIYEIDGNHFKYIWQNADGSYGKDVLTKATYTDYEQEIKSFQWGLTGQYLSPETSPLPQADIVTFAEAGGHEFFPIDEDYRITARFEPDTTGAQWTMATSDSSEVVYGVYGTAHFTIDGQPQQLTLYQPLSAESATGHEQRLFLPFRDATSGKSTYGGGRYIEVGLPVGDVVTIDFNRAYHPYCAYTVGYSCPVPPPQNTLTIRVEAGIRLQ